MHEATGVDLHIVHIMQRTQRLTDRSRSSEMQDALATWTHPRGARDESEKRLRVVRGLLLAPLRFCQNFIQHDGSQLSIIRITSATLVLSTPADQEGKHQNLAGYGAWRAQRTGHARRSFDGSSYLTKGGRALRFERSVDVGCGAG